MVGEDFFNKQSKMILLALSPSMNVNFTDVQLIHTICTNAHPFGTNASFANAYPALLLAFISKFAYIFCKQMHLSFWTFNTVHYVALEHLRICRHSTLILLIFDKVFVFQICILRLNSWVKLLFSLHQGYTCVWNRSRWKAFLSVMRPCFGWANRVCIT